MSRKRYLIPHTHTHIYIYIYIYIYIQASFVKYGRRRLGRRHGTIPLPSRSLHLKNNMDSWKNKTKINKQCSIVFNKTCLNNILLLKNNFLIYIYIYRERERERQRERVQWVNWRLNLAEIKTTLTLGDIFPKITWNYLEILQIKSIQQNRHWPLRQSSDDFGIFS